MTTCVHCGCSDFDPCLATGGARCSWSQVSEDGRFGVCSFCEEGEQEFPLEPIDEDRRIILPGDPDFHL